MVGQYIGSTGPKTQAKIREAKDGVMFVDEAYRLVKPNNSDGKDYGTEAIETIMQHLTDVRAPVLDLKITLKFAFRDTL